MLVYALLREAILSGEQVTATYHGRFREFCPHALGWKNGEEHCLAYQFGGSTGKGPVVLGAPDNWRCFVVSRLSDLSIHEGDWHTCETHGGVSTCLDRIDVEVATRHR